MGQSPKITDSRALPFQGFAMEVALHFANTHADPTTEQCIEAVESTGLWADRSKSSNRYVKFDKEMNLLEDVFSVYRPKKALDSTADCRDYFFYAHQFPEVLRQSEDAVNGQALDERAHLQLIQQRRTMMRLEAIKVRL